MEDYGMMLEKILKLSDKAAEILDNAPDPGFDDEDDARYDVLAKKFNDLIYELQDQIKVYNDGYNFG